VGDPIGMAVAHAQASGMGGMRTAGDLVARAQLAKRLRVNEAKKYVADKLRIGTSELSDPVVMSEVRADLGFGIMMPLGGTPKGLECKFNMARVLDLDINCLKSFKRKAGL
jgi:dimethylamine--corrinoid protein Co-methyltransferase